MCSSSCSAGLQAAFYAQSYIAQIDRLEQEARERVRCNLQPSCLRLHAISTELLIHSQPYTCGLSSHAQVCLAPDLAQALLEGKDEDEADEVQLPPIPAEDVKRLAKSAGRSTVRECTVTHIRCTGTHHCLPSLICTAMRHCEGCPENMSSVRLITLRGALSDMYSHAHEACTIIIASPSPICAAVRHLVGMHSAGCLCCAVWGLMAANFRCVYMCCWTLGLISLALACRRRIEHRLRGRVSDQLLWKSLKGASSTLPPKQADT